MIFFVFGIASYFVNSAGERREPWFVVLGILRGYDGAAKINVELPISGTDPWINLAKLVKSGLWVILANPVTMITRA